MNRGRWLLLAGAGLLLLALLLWLLWPGGDAPLAQFWRRDTTWEGMGRRGTWRVGLDPSFPPFEALDAGDRPAGYDVDLARTLAADWGLEVEIVPIGFDSLIDALQAAKIDAVVSAYPYDERLTRDVGYSQPYFDAGLRLVVREGSPIAGVADLAGKRVAVEWGSEGDMIGRQVQRNLEADGLSLTLVPFETPDEAVAALVGRGTRAAGDGSADAAGAPSADLMPDPVDALLVDGVTLRAAQAGGAALAAVGPALTSNPYVIVTPRRATELLQQVNTGLETLRREGVLAELEDRWFR